MASISSFERASVERRINAIKESLYELPLQETPPILRANQMRLLLGEICQLRATIGQSSATIQWQPVPHWALLHSQFAAT